jgi:hypothetical protein
MRLRRERAAWRCVLATFVTLALLVGDWYFRFSEPPFYWGRLGLVLAGLLIYELARRKSHRWTPPWKDLARRVEAFDPHLDGRLLTAVEQGEPTGWNYVQERLFSEVALLAKSSRWERCIPGWRVWGAEFVATSMVLVPALFVVLMPVLFSRPRGTAAVEVVEAAGARTQMEVQPGSVEIEKGTRLSVSARLAEMSPDVRLTGRFSGGETFAIPMQQSLNEPLYGGGLAAVETDLEYRVETPAAHSESFTVRVFEYPKLQRSDALVRYPAGMEPAERTFENARKLTVPEGGSIRWELQLNKMVQTARLLHKDGRTEELAVPAEGATLLWELEAVADAVSARLELVDAQGRSARETPEFQVQVLPNQPPKVRPILPKADARFTKIEEVDFVAEAWDDANLKRWGVTLQLGKGDPVEVVLGEHSKRGEKVRMNDSVALEEKGMEVGDSLTWFFWAEDLVRGGQVRRVESDLMLGRIRPFEEEYSQGEDGEGEGEAGKGGPQLLELQKQVLSATWNLRRKGAGTEFGKGVGTVKAAESKVLEMAGEAAAKEKDFVRKGYYQEALEQLEKAVELLGKTPENGVGLEPALQAERAAYAALTHLAPSSYQMTKGKPSKAQERTAQMNNLEFAKQEDRYEAKSEAQSAQQNEERAEMEELLAQLRALARRQEEVSERMRELDAVLRGAGEEKEKEAARRELKKLAEEQKALAQELESAQQKAAAKGESLANQTPQLDAAREDAQKAASAAERGSVDEARAAASRSMEKLREGSDSLRQQLSGQTREAASDLQKRAQELVDQERKLSEALAPDKKGPANLQEPALRKELGEQRQKLGELQSEMQRVADAAEASEPLFSKALQEAHRGTVQNQTDAKLKVASNALAYGQPQLARKAEASAAKDLNDLSAAVGKAADEVFGDDAQALKKARAVVDALAREAQPEGNRGDRFKPGDSAKTEAEEPGKEGADPSKKNGPGQPGEPGEKAGADPQAEQAKPGGSGKPAQPGQPAQLAEKGQQQQGQNGQLGQSGQQGQSDQPGQPGRDEKTAQSGGGKNPAEQGQPGEEGKQSGNQPGKGEAPKGGQPGRNPGNERTASDRNPHQQDPMNSKEGQHTAGTPSGGAVTQNGSYHGGGDGVPAQKLGEWLGQLDRVEALLERPHLRAAVARVQQSAEQLRADMKRNATKPSPKAIEDGLLTPLAQLRDAITAELARKAGRDSEGPVDRDPVPRKFEESVRRYYEALGGSR